MLRVAEAAQVEMGVDRAKQKISDVERAWWAVLEDRRQLVPRSDPARRPDKAARCGSSPMLRQAAKPQ